MIEVSGRTYPVEVRYRPLVDDDRVRRRGRRRARSRWTRSTAIADAVDELGREGDGDILVFLTGEREIRDTADALNKTRPAQHRDRPAVRPAVRGRAAPGLRAAHRPPGRARHQRRRDLADRARHPLRDRPRHRPDLPLQPAGSRCSGCRSSRSRRPAPTSARAAAAGPRDGICIRLYSEEDFAGRPGVHRAGDPAHQPGLGHPADDHPRPRRPGRVPVHRPAGQAQRHRRRQAARGARARSTDRKLTPLGRQLAQLPVDPRLARMVIEADQQELRRRGHGDRRGAVHPGPARAPGRQAAAGRRETRPVRRQGIRLLQLPQPVALPAGAAAGAVRQPVPPAVPQPSSSTTCGSASGRTSTRSCGRSPVPSGCRSSEDRRGRRRRRSACTPRCSPACSATSASRTPTSGSTSAPAAPSSRSSRARRCSRSSRAG